MIRRKHPGHRPASDGRQGRRDLEEAQDRWFAAMLAYEHDLAVGRLLCTYSLPQCWGMVTGGTQSCTCDHGLSAAAERRSIAQEARSTRYQLREAVARIQRLEAIVVAIASEDHTALLTTAADIIERNAGNYNRSRVRIAAQELRQLAAKITEGGAP